jgi:hypothetical protein
MAQQALGFSYRAMHDRFVAGDLTVAFQAYRRLERRDVGCYADFQLEITGRMAGVALLVGVRLVDIPGRAAGDRDGLSAGSGPFGHTVKEEAKDLVSPFRRAAEEGPAHQDEDYTDGNLTS